MTRRPVSNVVWARIRKLFADGDFDGCLQAFEKLEASRALSPAELVQKARCIQLSTGELASVDDAEESLRRALELDPEYLPALLELGWFHHTVRDDPRSALGFFEKALAISKAAGDEALKGLSECRNELKQERVPPD